MWQSKGKKIYFSGPFGCLLNTVQYKPIANLWNVLFRENMYSNPVSNFYTIVQTLIIKKFIFSNN